MDGILLLDKPIGQGSNQVLQQVKRMYRARKAGHTGSLDRLASGLLPICLGEATKFSGFLLDADKRYEAAFHLGESTSTGDAEGEVIERSEVPPIDRERLEAVADGFIGESEQIPPMHSAIKHQGQRLYKLAHQGLTVERKPRRITIREFTIIDAQSPVVRVRVRCTKGTYIRTLAEDFGRVLGCAAHVGALRRIGVGPFVEADMITLVDLEARAARGEDVLDALLVPMEASLSQWPRLDLAENVAFYLRKGQPVLVPHAPTQGLVRLYDDRARFLGAGEVLDDGRVAPRRMVSEPRI